MNLRRAWLALTLLLIAVAAHADPGTIRVSLFPQIAVADARSTVTVTAEIRTSGGRAAPNGTQVVFQTTLGHFQDATVNVSNGYARATLVTSDKPGTAKITVSAITLGATTSTDLELVANRSELSNARAYVEITAPKSLQYSMDYQVATASGLSRGVTVRAGAAKIQADDLQFSAQTQEIRARRAKITLRGHTHEFQDLLYNTRDRKGVGTTSYEGIGLARVRAVGHWYEFDTKKQRRFGLAQLLSSGEVLALPADAARPSFEFEDTSDSGSIVTAKTAIIFPNREVQFQHAELAVNGTRVLKLEHYKLDLMTANPGFGEQILTMNDNRLGINYPHYLSLTPNETSLLRFRTGEAAGRSLTGNSGSFLDYEWTWNKGEGSEGGLTLTGINRSDWSMDARHTLHFNDGSSINALLSSPARRSIYGSVGYNKPLDGYQLNVNASSNRSLTGMSTNLQSLSMVLESDPRRLQSLPLTLYYGLNAAESRSQYGDIRRDSRYAGLRLRGQFDPFRLDSKTALSSSFTVGQRLGTNNGLAIYGSLGLARSMPWGGLSLNYDYADDATLASTQALGKQRLSLEGNYEAGRSAFHLYASRSLDQDWASLYGDLSYRVSGLYRFSAGYTFDKYLADQNLDYNFMLSYRLGLREVGLTWSRRTNRVGLEVLGARF